MLNEPNCRASCSKSGATPQALCTLKVPRAYGFGVNGPAWARRRWLQVQPPAGPHLPLVRCEPPNSPNLPLRRAGSLSHALGPGKLTAARRVSEDWRWRRSHPLPKRIAALTARSLDEGTERKGPAQNRLTLAPDTGA